MLERSVAKQCGQKLDPSDGEEDGVAARAWDKRCQQFSDVLGAPDKSWHTVHFPFAVSVDNARVHDRGIRMMFSPRIPPHKEERMVDEAACCELDNVRPLPERLLSAIDEMQPVYERELSQNDQIRTRSAAEHTECANKYKALGKIRENLNKAEDKYAIAVELREGKVFDDTLTRRSCYYSVHENVSRQVYKHAMDQRQQPETAYHQQNNVKWEDQYRRRMARADPRWRCLKREQTLIPAPVTPDLHCPAEMLVCCGKRDAAKCIQEMCPDHEHLMSVPHLQAMIVNGNLERNQTREGRDTDAQIELQESVCKARAIHLRVGTDESETVEVLVNPGEARRRKKGYPARTPQIQIVQGTGGKYAGGKFA